MKQRLIWKLLSKLRTDLPIFICVAFVFCFIGNFLAEKYLQRYPEILMTSGERVSENTRAIREKMVPDALALEWYGIKDLGEVKALWSEFYDGGQEYEAYTQWRHKPKMGDYYRVTEAGYRETREPGPWPPEAENFNIFFFGGSTAFQPGPAWTSVASYLQDDLNQNRKGRKVYVYNFGRSGYMSTQEMILFQELLKSYSAPNMAVFMDGLNDFCYIDGKPGGWQGVAADYNRKIDNHMNAARGYGIVTKWNVLREFFVTLPLTRALVGILEHIFTPDIRYNAPEANSPLLEMPVDQETLKSIIQRYKDNVRIVTATAKVFDVTPFFVWQPIPLYKYDAGSHMFYPSRVGCHINSVPGYPMMEKEVNEHPFSDDFLWLADIQEDSNDPLYLDAFHYTAPMAKRIAHLIGEEMRKKHVIKPDLPTNK